MDPRLLAYYDQELRYLRDTAGDFARDFPKIAARLGLDGVECADPYVERLLEGFAYLTARVQLKLDAEFPRFTQHLLELVYPHYLAPTPSMAVVQFQPDLTEGSLAAGVPLPRDTVLRGQMAKGDQTACEYRTAHPVTLWPLELVAADYFSGRGPVSSAIPEASRAKAGMRLRLRCGAGLTFDQLALTRLPLFLRGADATPARLYEQLIGHSLVVVAQPPGAPPAWTLPLRGARPQPLGLGDEEALLPFTRRSFQGYRLLAEYFAFPQRFLFVELGGLQPALARGGTELDLVALFDRHDPTLEGRVDTQVPTLFCAPAVNLFPRRCDRIHLTNQVEDFHLVPDRTRPRDFEVYAVTEVMGYGSGGEEQPFRPFYAADALPGTGDQQAYYTLQRQPRVLSARDQRQGPRSSYVGTEVFLALADPRAAPYRGDLRQLGVTALCTNRDLPLRMRFGQADTDFFLDTAAPVGAIRAVAGPSWPRAAPLEAETVWRLVSHLSLNYLSLADQDPDTAAAGLRELLSLYAYLGEPAVRRQIDGVRRLTTRRVVRRLPIPGPITFGRGIEIQVGLDETAFEGSGVFLLGTVLEQFFARYVSINSFTETAIGTGERPEVMRWPARIGRRHTL